ncbi:unnamed protein product, partial [marine sediment metagenome]
CSATVSLTIKVSDTLRNSNDAEKNSTSSSYVNVKEVLLNKDLANCRLKFSLASSLIDKTAYAKVYKNGDLIGEERSTTITTWSTFSEDFAGWVSGDLIQIYAKRDFAGASAKVKDMRFYYDEDDKITEVGGEELDTPLGLVSVRDPTISVTNQDP